LLRQRSTTPDLPTHHAPYTYHCHTCQRAARIARRCPLPPPQWSQLADAGLHVSRSGNASRKADKLQAQLDTLQAQGTGVTLDTKNLALEEIERLRTQALIERASGAAFGAPHDDLCAWYQLQAEAPWVSFYLSEIRLDSNYGAQLWSPGGLHAQPADMLDALDALRSEYAQIDREEMARQHSKHAHH